MANKTPNKVITAVAFLGCSSIVTGVTLIYHPLGYITTGVILLTLASLAARRA